MSVRKVLIYLAVFLGLAAYFYYFEVVRPKHEAEAEKREKRLFSVEAPDLTRLAITRDSSRMELEKKDGKWRITSPVDAPADSFEMDSLTEALTSASLDREMAAPGDLARFGLNKPSLVVEFEAKERKGALLLGSSSPVGDGRYAMRKGEDRVLVVDGFSLKPLEKDLYRLREKSLFTLKEEDVEKIRVERRGESFTLEKKESGWVAAGRKGFRVGGGKVAELLDNLLFTRAASFLDEKKPRQVGLDSPDIVVELESGERAQRLELEPRKEGGAFAAASVRPGVVTVADSDLKKLPASLEDLEDLTFLALDEAGVRAVDLEFGAGKKFSFTKDEDRWKSREGKSVEGWVMNAMFSRLEKLEYEEISSKTPPGDPTLEVTLAGEGEEELLRASFHKAEDGYRVVSGEKTYKVKGPDARLLVEWLEKTVTREAGGAPE